MRAAAIFGLGTSPGDLKQFQTESSTKWRDGLPASPSDADAILVFGGDGTIHRHLAALVRLKLPVLVVPAGSGNDFARALNLRSVAASLRAWQKFEAGRLEPRAIDLGLISPADLPEKHHFFCCVAGCGLDSAVARLANQMPRWLRARGGYAMGLVPTILRFAPFSLRITMQNGGASQSSVVLTTLATFANTQYYGDGMRIAPRAEMDDGMLDVCLIREVNKWKMLSLFPTVYFGRHLNLRESAYSKAESVRLETATPCDIYADGEYVCATPAEIRIVPHALQVIAPMEGRASREPALSAAEGSSRAGTPGAP
jgi:diacylglycerol kinase (ATP)